MRKTILMLINGFGVEQKGSYELYSPKLFPNLDNMMKSYLFGTLTASAGDYSNGYKNFSIPTKAKGSEDEIDQLIFERKLDRNETLQKIASELSDNNKLHIFYNVENGEKFGQVKEILRTINAQKNKKVFVHLVMTSTSTNSYKNISKVIGKLSYETSMYCKLGMIVGKKNINTDDMLRTFYKEFGEHWNESEKKIAVLEHDIINPEDAGVFYINGGFALQENDVILFMNYNDVDIERFYGEFSKVASNMYSLFELRDGISNIFKKSSDDVSSIASICDKFGIKLLVLTDTTRINDLNFFLNGMKRVQSPNITYAVNDFNLFNNKENIIKLVDGNYDGIIIDYNIGLLSQMAEIKKVLGNIDTVIGNISQTSLEKNYTFIVSSLYGMYSSVMDGVVPRVINFAGKVPCLFQSNDFVKSGYALQPGDTYGLGLTFLTNINDEVKSNKIVHQLGKMEKMLSGKK